ncbi:preprotein translocase subunit YajC [bacterium]|nr:preprotein translocase subunit YajC [bacterium]
MEYSSLIFLVLFIAVFYFLIFRPQIQKAKKQKEFKDALNKGDRVVTTGGIHGKILEMKDLTVTLDVGNGVKLKIDRSAISMEASELLKNQAES